MSKPLETTNRCVMPVSIRIIGMTIPLEIRNADNDTALDTLYGYCDHKRGLIVLNDSNSAERMKECSVHEIVHMLEAAIRLSISEEEVGRFGRALYALIRDNPDLLEWLQS